MSGNGRRVEIDLIRRVKGQPVLLKMGGGVRVLFVKVTRAFEVTRTDCKRVVPFGSEQKPSL